MKKKVKIGILIDRNDIDFFSFEIIDWLKKNNKKYKIYFLDQNLKKKNSLKKIISIFLRLRFFYLINTLF